MARGGRRPGAGRKPKNGGIVLRHPSAGAVPVPVPPGPVLPPAGLDPEALEVWNERAPYAIARQTLDQSSAPGFARYCELVVLERHEAKSTGRGGPNHIKILNYLEKAERSFSSYPIGRPMPQIAGAAEQQPTSKLGRFR